MKFTKLLKAVFISAGIMTGAICLVLASEVFQEEDYLRNYEDFQSRKHSNTPDR